MMNKVAQFYRELVSTLSERLRNGERDIDALVEQARVKISQSGELTHREVETLTKAVRRDLEEFARSYEESQDELTDSVFMRVIKRACGRSWRILPIKPSWNGAKCSRISTTTGFTIVAKWWGWETWCANTAIITWRSIPRIFCRVARNAAMTSSSVVPLSLDTPR
jgi:hypothetical protein